MAEFGSTAFLGYAQKKAGYALVGLLHSAHLHLQLLYAGKSVVGCFAASCFIGVCIMMEWLTSSYTTRLDVSWKKVGSLLWYSLYVLLFAWSCCRLL